MRHSSRVLPLIALLLILPLSACGAGQEAADEAPPAGPLCEGELSLPVVGEDYGDLGGGLLYKDLRIGTGTVVEAGTRVDAHYAGFLEDGSMFDSSCTRGMTFPVTVGTGGVITGWDQGLQGMADGGRRILVVPSDLGYKDAGLPQIGIPGGATLIFDVEVTVAP